MAVKRKAGKGRKAAPRRKTTTAARKRSSGRRRSRGLSEGLAENLDFTRNGSTTNTMLKGAAGAGVAYLVTANQADPKKAAGICLLVALGAAMMGQGEAAAGAAGVAAYKFLDAGKTAALAEGNAQFIDPAMLADDEPAQLDAEGNALSEDDQQTLLAAAYQPYFEPEN